MKNLKFSLIVFGTFFLMAGMSYSQTVESISKKEATYRILNRQEDDKVTGAIQNNKNLTIKTAQKTEKSPFLGAVLSGVLPGAGEFYAQSFVKSAIFFAAEVGLWTAFAIFETKGNNQTDVFERFANQNWNVRKYAQWLVNQQFEGFEAINPEEQNLEVLRNQINGVERLNFSHSLPPYGDQQYYELIGKYQNFVAGWADVDINLLTKDQGSPYYYGIYKSPMFIDYSKDRQTANDYYDKSSLAISGVIINHILSAADAAWSVSLYNKEIRMKTSLKMENRYSYAERRSKLMPFAHLTVNF